MILTFYSKELNGSGQYGPAYYMPYGATQVNLRIHAATAPMVDDARFEIYDDGVSIMENRTPTTLDDIVPPVAGTPDTTVILAKDQTSEGDAEDFIIGDIAEGSWVTCEVVNNGGGKGFTIQLELLESDE